MVTPLPEKGRVQCPSNFGRSFPRVTTTCNRRVKQLSVEQHTHALYLFTGRGEHRRLFHYLLYKFFVATIDARTMPTLGACRRAPRLNLSLPPPPPRPLTPPPLLHVYRKLSRSLARSFTLSHLSLTAAHPLLPFVSLSSSSLSRPPRKHIQD
jgi:hypothetical protein